MRLVYSEAFKFADRRWRDNLRQGLSLDLREPRLVSGWGDRKVFNFEQILFANGRMLDLTEVPAQRGRAVNSTF
jgi:hypothetical protein